jgi:manganese efflux pump family protein
VTYLELIILAVALAIDAVSVAASAGPRSCPRWGALRLGLSFGAFQAGMPLLGALAGAYLYGYVRAYDHWVAFGLLLLVGMKMLAEAVRSGAGEKRAGANGFDPSAGWSLLGLSVATSIDAFGAGIGLRMAGANLWVAAPLIGAITAALSYVGAHLGVRAERYLGRRAEAAGGVVLIGLAVRMLRI